MGANGDFEVAYARFQHSSKIVSAKFIVQIPKKLNEHDTSLDTRPAYATTLGKKHGLTVAALFAGIGGLELGLARSSFQTVFACEIDETARKLFRLHFPRTRLCSDIRTLRSIPRTTVVTAGFPCQDLSQAPGGAEPWPPGRLIKQDLIAMPVGSGYTLPSGLAAWCFPPAPSESNMLVFR